ncbi:MAG: hypothetical protein JSW58_08460 [Candidatus Latescibacterota bacterium]|nr:MAG: hypothetical protein JSW58_08460 [Candidatus Latescibacterota bacterium]
MSITRVHDWAGRFTGVPLAIWGPGPSYDIVPPDLKRLGWNFALNNTITEFLDDPDVFWVSNDHDRTFENVNIRRHMLPILKNWKPWRTITNRKFIPGEFGDIDWIDHKGNAKGPTDFRLPCPKEDLEVWWYHENEGFEGYLYHGDSVLELALEVATLWGFSPIVLFGIDLQLLKKPRPAEPQYYAKPWQWKETPRRILKGHKLSDMILGVRARAEKWKKNIFHTSPYRPKLPFVKVSFDLAREMLHAERVVD